MSDPVELEVVERDSVSLTTNAVIPAPEPGWSLELDRTATHVRVRQVRDDETTPWVDVVPLSLLQGKDGSTPFLRATATHLEWSQDGVEWFPLVALEDLKGDDGADAYEVAVALGYEGDREQWLAELHGVNGQDGWTPYLYVSATHIQVGYSRGEETEPPFDLIALSALTGADGYSVEVQKTATHIQWRQRRGTTVTAWVNLVALTDITGPAGQGVPTGGVTGQMLVKTSATNYATAWQTPATPLDLTPGTGSPEGVVVGTIGQRYTDTANTAGALQWVKATGTGNTGWRVSEGDTGWRNIISTCFVNNPNAATLITTGNQPQMLVRRINGVVHLGFNDIIFGGATNNQLVRLDLPEGFRIGNVYPGTIFAVAGGNVASASAIRFDVKGAYLELIGIVPATRLREFKSFPANPTTWPSTNPGIPGTA